MPIDVPGPHRIRPPAWSVVLFALATFAVLLFGYHALRDLGVLGLSAEATSTAAYVSLASWFGAIALTGAWQRREARRAPQRGQEKRR